MTPYYQHNGITIFKGHVLDVLRYMPDESVQMCVTSPPYWGLRDYGLKPVIWDDPGDCEHEWGKEIPGDPRGGSGPNAKEFYAGDGKATYARQIARGNICRLCGAWRGSLGLEPDPWLYIKHLVEIFREVRRVLRNDGTMFLNMGDSYATGAGKVGEAPGGGPRGELFKRHFGKSTPGSTPAMRGLTQPNRMPIPGLKPKDLCMIPARVAIALQEDGWYLRSDIIWSKPNPMPESVKDRPTKAHEYIFLLSKSQKYFFDQDAVRENQCEEERARRIREHNQGLSTVYKIASEGKTGLSPHKGAIKNAKRRGELALEGKRNIRSVWTVSTHPFPEAHFAVFPEKLIEPCIKSGSRIGDIVLDPFGGSGTTARVAQRLNRKAVLIDLSPEYCEMSTRFLNQEVFPFKEKCYESAMALQQQYEIIKKSQCSP